MSFILDALRKSEQERQQGQVPVVSSVPLAIERPRTPVWAGLLILGLGVAVTGLAWLWWQDRQHFAARQADPALAERPLTAVSGEPLPASPTVSLSRLAQPPADSAARNGPEVAPGTAQPPSQPVPMSPAGPPNAAGPVSATPPAPSATLAAPYLPTRGELLAQGVNVPAVELQLHVYSDAAARRFVFLNGTKYVEGNTLPEGPRVMEITPDGVRLRHSNREFFLARN